MQRVGYPGVQANGVWEELAGLKKVVTEPKGTGEAFEGVMKDYYGAIRKGQGALFMAVCRGKVTGVCASLCIACAPLPLQQSLSCLRCLLAAIDSGNMLCQKIRFVVVRRHPLWAAMSSQVGGLLLTKDMWLTPRREA